MTKNFQKREAESQSNRPQSIKDHPADQRTLEGRLQEAFQQVSEVEHHLEELSRRWLQMKRALGDWTYEHVPEWILSLPGHSRIWMPDLEITIPTEKASEIRNNILELSTDLDKIEHKTVVESHAIIAAKLRIIDSLEGVLSSIPFIRTSVLTVEKGFAQLQPALKRIVKLRNEVDRFRQPPVNSELLQDLWNKLDHLQYEFDSRVWEDLMYVIDGKAEVSIYSKWKKGIIERESQGLAPQMVRLSFQLRTAHELARLAMTESRADSNS